MDKSNLKLLAEIAMLGSNTAQTRDAHIIIDALKLTFEGEGLALHIQALNEFNQGKFDIAVATLSPWCDKNPAGINHALLGLIYSVWGQNSLAERQSLFVLDNSEEVAACELARATLENMGITV